MEEDIQNYSLTVMFRGTPCISLRICMYIVHFSVHVTDQRSIPSQAAGIINTTACKGSNSYIRTP